MSKPKGKSNNLPPLQKRIILYLAKHEPQTINKINSKIRPPTRNKSLYKSTWTAMKALKGKGMTKEVTLVEYRGNEYPCFWLTDLGVFTALVEGADAQDLLEKTIKTYPNNKILQCCLAIARFIDIKFYRIALSAILNKGKLEQSDLITLMVTQAQKDSSIEQFKQFLDILKKYLPPEEYKKLDKQINQYADLFKKIGEMM
jgi:hypothetical protein